MEEFIRLVGPRDAVEVFGIRLVGINADTGKKVLFTIAVLLLAVALTRLLRALAAVVVGRRAGERVRFWSRQGISLSVTVVTLVVLVSIWFDDPDRLAMVVGLVTAGLAFALQRVVTAFAGYLVILRGRTFGVGDRIRMAGVRGDVIGLGFIQTRIMEMGQPPTTAGAAEPEMWVRSRQYTGRIVTVTNDKVFDEPVYNYTHDFPYIWEELTVPIPYRADRRAAERILLDAAARHTVRLADVGAEAIEAMRRRYFLERGEVSPQVYLRLTDNWIEATVRFVAPDHGIRDLKDRITRDVLDAFDREGISVASATIDVVGVPPLRVEAAPGRGEGGEGSRSGGPGA